MFDVEGQLRSSYDIFYDLSQIWDTLDKNTQNYIASQQASTNQFQNFAALMSNFPHAVEATNTAMESVNSAVKENEKYMEGLEAKTQAVASAYEKLSNSIVNSNLVKLVLDLTKGFIGLADTGIGHFVTQTALIGGALWGGSGLISAMKLIPSLLTKAGAAAGVTGKILALSAPELFLIAAGLAAIIALAPKIYEWAKNLHKDTAQLTEELSSAEEQLANNKARLEELNSVPYYNRTSDINAEIYALEKENAELQKRIDLTKEQLGLRQTSNLRQDTTYLVKDTALHITSPYYDQTFPNLERAIANLKAEKRLPEDWSGDLEQFKRELESLGYAVEEQEGAYATLEYSITTLVAEYQSLYNKQQQGRALTVEEQQRIVELTGLLSGFVSRVEDIEGGLDYLTDGEKRLYLAAKDLSEGFEDVREATYAMGEEVSGSARLFNDLLAGMQLTNEQKDILIKKYPKLNSLIEQGTHGWKLQSDALQVLIGSEEEWAKSAIASTNAVLQSQITYAQASYRSAIELAKTLRLSGDFEGYEKQKKAATELFDYYLSISSLQKELDFQKKYYRPKKTLTFDQEAAGSSGGKSSRQRETDKIKEQNDLFKDRISVLDHELFLLEKAGASDEDRIAKLKEIQQELHNQANWFRAQGLSEESEQIREKQKLWYQYEDTIVNIYKSIEQKAKESHEKMLENQKKGLEKQAKLYESVYDYYNEEAEAYEALADYMQDRIDREIDLIQGKIDALDKENDEIEKQIELEEKLDALARAKSSKVLVYKDGAFQYAEDVDAVSGAAKDLSDFNRAQELANKKAALQNEIDILNKYKDEWAKLTDSYDKAQSKRLILEKLGIDVEKMNFEKFLSNTQEFVEKYEAAMNRATEAYDKFVKAQEAANRIGSASSSTSASLNKTGQAIGGAIGKVTSTGIVGAAIGTAIGGVLSHVVPKYAKGSTSTAGGISLVGETGPELRLLGENDGILPSDITKNLWAWGALNPSAVIKNAMGFNSASDKQVSITIQNFNPNLPNVTDGADFANYMRNNFWRDTIQFAKA